MGFQAGRARSRAQRSRPGHQVLLSSSRGPCSASYQPRGLGRLLNLCSAVAVFSEIRITAGNFCNRESSEQRSVSEGVTQEPYPYLLSPGQLTLDTLEDRLCDRQARDGSRQLPPQITGRLCSVYRSCQADSTHYKTHLFTSHWEGNSTPRYQFMRWWQEPPSSLSACLPWGALSSGSCSLHTQGLGHRKT